MNFFTIAKSFNSHCWEIGIYFAGFRIGFWFWQCPAPFVFRFIFYRPEVPELIKNWFYVGTPWYYFQVNRKNGDRNP